MENIVFVTDPKYCGMFVALKSLEDKEVIASGDNMSQVVFDARDKGYPDALVTYIPAESAQNRPFIKKSLFSKITRSLETTCKISL